MKRITILERSYTTRKKGGWFSTENDADVLFDLTDIQLAKYLEKVNKNYRTNFYQVKADFNLKSKKGQHDYVTYLINNYKKFTQYQLIELKNVANNIICSL